jgi:hypothetical protein
LCAIATAWLRVDVGALVSVCGISESALAEKDESTTALPQTMIKEKRIP